MSDDARTVLVITDDPRFSGQVSDLMLRAGVRKVRFARSRDALAMTYDIAPDMILLHMPRASTDAGWACYEMLQSDVRASTIPVLIYAPPSCQEAPLREKAIGEPEPEPPGARLVANAALLLGGRESSLVGMSEEKAAGLFPIGRDDL